MNATRKVKLKDITSNLTCQLCLGYFIDATTIIECLHSFCKSCIVKHLEKSEYCPVCDVQLHSTKPLSSIRSDQMLQEIVYKLVPGLFRKEMSLRRDFYEKNEECSAINQIDSGQIFNELYITSDDIIHLSLEYFTDDPAFKDKTKRYLKCPAAVSISILKKLVQGKFDLKSDVEIDVMYGERILPDEFLLMDIAYKYSWTSNGSKPLQLSYRVRGLFLPAEHKLQSNKFSTPISAENPSQIKRRRSRASVDSDVTRSEILKSSNRNLPIEADSKTLISSITPKLTPNGKIRGRRKRCLIEDGGKSPAENKRKKAGKNSPVKDSKEMECQSEPTISKSSEIANGMEKEVQLRISENGVISAKSVFSGEEKIIGSLLKSPSKSNGPSTAMVRTEPRNGLCSNNNNEKSTNVSEDGVYTNFVPAKANPGPMHPLLIHNSIGITSKPNYVKLNIPIVTTTSTSHSPPNTNGLKVLTKGNVNGSPCAKIPIASPQKLTPSKRKLIDKVVGGSNPNGPLANPKEFEDKQANVKKALIDLEKKLYTSISKGSLSKLPGMLGITSSSNNREGLDESNGNHLGTNESQNISKSQPQLNGTNLQNAFPFPLSFGSSGMTVNLISSTTNCPSAMGSITSPISNSSPQKKSAHQTTVVNGDLKFTSSPRHILPSPSKELVLPAPVSLSPKKPPKFFKSRHSSTAISGTTPASSESESPVKKDPSMKIVSANGNSSPSFSFGSSSTPTSSKSSSCSIGANTITTPSGMGNSHLQLQAARLQSQVSNAFNPMNLQLNQLQMSLAASSANNIPMTLVPFVTSNYCSMPFLNSRQQFGLPTFPFAYPGMSGPTFTQSQPYSLGTTLNGNMNGGHHLHIPNSPKTSQSTDTGKNNGHQFLDLSMNKSNSKGRNGNSSRPQEEPLSLKKSVSPKTSPPSLPKTEKLNKIDASNPQINGPMSLVTKSKLVPELNKEINSKPEILDCSLNNKKATNDVTKEINDIKIPSDSKANAEIQPQPLVMVSNDSNTSIGNGDNNNTTAILDTLKSDAKVSIKLQNGHPQYSIPNAEGNIKTDSSDATSKPEITVKDLPKQNFQVNQDGIEINGKSMDPESIRNGDQLTSQNISKTQIPSCNNNNGPAEVSHTSSTTGA